MKKLMIAAAAAAMIGGAFADGVAQVYDFTATVKTSACSGKSAKDVCGDTVYYRSQISQKLYGKFWGCGCKVIACPDNYGMPYEDDQGYMFWLSTKQDGAFHGADMSWSILQRLGKKGENVEGAFDLTLADCDGETVAVLKGAGYGTAKIYCEEGLSTEESYIKSMAGNIVGTWDASSDVIATGCAYCGAVDECTVFAFCECVAENNDQAAVYGTFTIKYNAGQTKSVNSGKYIDEVAFKNNKAVLAEFDCIAADDDDDDDDDETAAEKAQKTYNEAKATYVAATNAYQTAADKYTELIKVGAVDSDKGITLANTAALAKNAADRAKTALDKVTVESDIVAVDEAYAEVKAAETALADAQEALANAKNQAAVTAAKAAIEKATADLADANTGLTNAKKAADATRLAAYEKARTAYDAAAEAQDAADKAYDTYVNGDVETEGSYKKEVADALQARKDAEAAAAKAKDDLNLKKIACIVAGAKDCE